VKSKKKKKSENTHRSLIINRTDPRFRIGVLEHDFEPSTDLVEIRLQKVAYEAPCIDNDEKLLARNFILLLYKNQISENGGDFWFCAFGKVAAVAKRVPTLNGFFFDFAMRIEMVFQSPGEYSSERGLGSADEHGGWWEERFRTAVAEQARSYYIVRRFMYI